MKPRHRGRKAESKPGDHESEIMTLHEVADYLLCHYSMAHRMACDGKLVGFRLGGTWRFRRADLKKWIAQQHAPAGESVPPPGKGHYKRKS